MDLAVLLNSFHLKCVRSTFGIFHLPGHVVLTSDVFEISAECVQNILSLSIKISSSEQNDYSVSFS